MIFNINEIRMTSDILRKKIGTVDPALQLNEKYTEAKIFTSIKNNAKKYLENCQKVNSLALTITKSLINYNKKNLPTEMHIGLKEYAKFHNLRIGVIKKILAIKGYLVDSYPTGKSFRMDVVFTTYHKYKNTAMKTSTPEILTLWKKGFLDKILKNSENEVKDLSEHYTYSKPRSNNECFNMIMIHYEYLTKEKLADIEDLHLIMNKLNKKNYNNNELKRFKILQRYIKFYFKNYIES
jgi:hypothetical protein